MRLSPAGGKTAARSTTSPASSEPGAGNSSSNLGPDLGQVLDRPRDDLYTLQKGVRLDGFEFRKMAVFGNIKDLVQIGLESGGGAGWAKGLAWREREILTPGPFRVGLVYLFGVR